MQETRKIVLGGLLACAAAFFQTLPVFLSEAFVILTLFSALPIYIICRISPKIGIASTIASFLLISLFSAHEALFFICTNAPVGISLGCSGHFAINKKSVVFISSITLACTLCVMNFIIGIPIFGTQLPGALLIQLLIIAAFSLVYTLIYLYFCNFIFNKLNRFTKTF